MKYGGLIGDLLWAVVVGIGFVALIAVLFGLPF